MIGPHHELPPPPPPPGETGELRLPEALAKAEYSRTWDRGLHIYGARVRKSSWTDASHPQGMIAMFAGRVSGEARWIDRNGTACAEPLSSGSVWFVAPGVSHSCTLDRKANVVMIFLERWRINEYLGPRSERVAGTGAIAPLRSYFPVLPILRDLHKVVVHQIDRRTMGRGGEDLPDQIDAALVFARHLWLFHYCGLRTKVDGEDPSVILAELTSGALLSDENSR